jgi:hypothetical protein
MNIILGAITIATITPVINSITAISQNVFSMINIIRSTSSLYQADIQAFLNKSDIEATINLIHTIITEIPSYYNESTSIIIALQNMQKIILEIESELKALHDNILYNESLYFMKSMRGYNLASHIDTLNDKISILDKRKDNLFKTLEIFKNCVKK